MGTAANVKMGVCSVAFGGVDLGYTKGGVKVSYKMESLEKTVDQEDAPIGETISKQTFEVKVPLAEYDLAKLKDLFPGATLVTDTTKNMLVLSGASGTNLTDMQKELVLTPAGGTANEKLTVLYAIPKGGMEFAFEKDNVRVYEVTFTATVGDGGWVNFGDKAALSVNKVWATDGGVIAANTAEAIKIRGTGFVSTPTTIEINNVACTSIVRVSDFLVTAITAATHGAGTYDIEVTVGGVTKTLTGGVVVV